MTDSRPLLRAIFEAAVAAAHPDVVLSAHLRPVPKGRIIALAAGKGAAAMAAAAERHYLDALELDPERLMGVATTRHGHGVPTRLGKGGGTGQPGAGRARVKGGGRARAAMPAEIVTLAISDVPRDDPSAIASGPTVPDPTTLADARAIVAKYGLKVDDAIRRALDDPKNESCKPGDDAFARAQFELIARPKASLDAAIRVARQAGYEIVDLGADIEGEARSVAAGHAKLALEARAAGKRVAVLSGGELTVTVRGNGRGGPNQEYALALAGHLKDTPGISALAADTDGADGGAGSADDPAGAMIDPNTFAKMTSLGLDPRAYLDNNDATAFFAATGDLLLTGPTLTNVNDIRVILVDSD